MLIQKLIYINNATLVLQYQIVENLVMSFSYETLQKKSLTTIKTADLVSLLLLPMINNQCLMCTNETSCILQGERKG